MSLQGRELSNAEKGEAQEALDRSIQLLRPPKNLVIKINQTFKQCLKKNQISKYGLWAAPSVSKGLVRKSGSIYGSNKTNSILKRA